jgi:hypothetical protein
MTCPACLSDLGTPDAGLHTCHTCARTLVIGDREARTAQQVDIANLSAGELASRRKGRPAAWRANVVARKKEIRGR